MYHIVFKSVNLVHKQLPAKVLILATDTKNNYKHISTFTSLVYSNPMRFRTLFLQPAQPLF